MKNLIFAAFFLFGCSPVVMVEGEDCESDDCETSSNEPSQVQSTVSTGTEGAGRPSSSASSTGSGGSDDGPVKCESDGDVCNGSGRCRDGLCYAHPPVVCGVSTETGTKVFVGCDGFAATSPSGFNLYLGAISSDTLLCSGQATDVGFCKYGEICGVVDTATNESYFGNCL